MRLPAFAAVCGLAACRPPLPDPSASPTDADAGVVVEPPADPGAIHPVSRLRFAASGSDDVLLVRGALSSYHLGKLRERDLPKTLLERVVPARRWAAGDQHTLRPLVLLELGETYSLASAERGLLAQLVVRADPVPVLERVWPPMGAGASPDYWLFCGEAPADVTGEQLAWLEPGPHPVWARAEGLGHCLSLTSAEPAAPVGALVPPLAALGLALSPAVLDAVPGAPSAPLACAGSEIPLGPGCAAVLDDRALVRTAGVPTLWSLSGELVVASGGRLVVRGLPPASLQTLSVWVRDPFAELFRGEVTFATGAPQPHVVISEVFANPNGPEPAAEWVELTNDGSESVDLSLFELRDQGGAVALPPYVLAPGAFALLARSDYEPDTGPDPKPFADTAIVRVKALGKNGLSNSGEALELVRADGVVVSRFPALPKPKPGVSVARRTPWTFDDDPAGFGLHAPPGASPGQANVVAE